MAGNVKNNIESIGGHCDFITNPNFQTVTKTRYVTKKANHMFCRIDTGGPINRITQPQLISIPLSQYSAIAISDYDKGFLTQEDISYITQNHELVFLDTKKILGSWAENSAFIKINGAEYKASKSEIIKHNLHPLIIHTLGSGGCSYGGRNYPVDEVEVKDLSGAGDSFLAALIVKYLENNNIEESLVWANQAASIVVQKIGVSTINE